MFLKGFVLFCVSFLIVCSEKSNKPPREDRMLRKGGMSKLEKKKMDLSKVYIHPDMRDQIKISNNADLVKYTVCEGRAYELQNNSVTSTVFEYTICPVSKFTGKATVDTIKDYCCYVNSTLECCNLEAYKEYTAVSDKLLKAKLWRAGAIIITLIVVIVIICTVKKHWRKWAGMRRGGGAAFHPVAAGGVTAQPVTNTTVVVAAPQPVIMPQQQYQNNMAPQQSNVPPGMVPQQPYPVGMTPQQPYPVGMAPQQPYQQPGMPQVTTNTTMGTMVTNPMGTGMMVSPDNQGTITDGNPALPMAPIPKAPPGSYPTNNPGNPPAYSG